MTLPAILIVLWLAVVLYVVFVRLKLGTRDRLRASDVDALPCSTAPGPTSRRKAIAGRYRTALCRCYARPCFAIA